MGDNFNNEDGSNVIVEEVDDNDWVMLCVEERSKKSIDLILNKTKLSNNGNLTIEDCREIMKHFTDLDFNDAQEFVQSNNYHLIELFCKLMANCYDVEFVTEFIKFINVVGQIEGTMKKLVEMESFKWILPNCFLSKEEEAHNYLTTLILIFTKVDIVPSNEMNKWDQSLLEGFIDLGLNYAKYYDNKWLHTFFYSALGYQKHIISDTFSPLIYQLYAIQKAPELGPELISLLNRGNFEYDLIPQCLSLINDLFSYSVEFQVPIFFFSLDIRVLIDIIIREIHNLEECHPLRWTYLTVLHTILQHPIYIELQHKIDDIKITLEDLTSESSSEKDPRSNSIARLIIKYLNQI